MKIQTPKKRKNAPKLKAGVELGVAPGLPLAFLSALIISSNDLDAVTLLEVFLVPAKRLLVDEGE